jgi:hypothetical protein
MCTSRVWSDDDERLIVLHTATQQSVHYFLIMLFNYKPSLHIFTVQLY